jgi:hypothetical protein
MARQAITGIGALANSIILIAFLSGAAGGTTVNGHIPNTSLCRADAANSKALVSELLQYEGGDIGPSATWPTVKAVLLTLLTSNLSTYSDFMPALRHAPESVRNAGTRMLTSLGVESGALIKSTTRAKFDSASWPSDVTAYNTLHRYLVGKCGATPPVLPPGPSS